MKELTFKNLKLNLDLKSCMFNEKIIPLTKHEFELLKFLIQNKNKIHSRQDILKSVWNSKVELRTVDATVSRLRKKINTNYITTRLGFGYGLIE